MRIYVSGPMSGMKHHNFPAFYKAARVLRDKGHHVVNPADLAEPKGIKALDVEERWKAYMRRDIVEMIRQRCCTIAVLPGWMKSKGATLEVHVGQTLGMDILVYPSLKRFKESALEEAYRLVHASRGDDYGHPYDDFVKTATMWTGLFYHKLKDPVKNPIRPEEVPLGMVCVKLSREVNKPKRDNRADGAGYFETCDMVHERKGT